MESIKIKVKQIYDEMTKVWKITNVHKIVLFNIVVYNGQPTPLKEPFWSISKIVLI